VRHFRSFVVVAEEGSWIANGCGRSVRVMSTATDTATLADYAIDWALRVTAEG
jgi:hypothetical protein